MQMYRVAFHVHYENIMEQGEAIVCANDADAASHAVIALLQLPPEATQCETSRLKPNLYLLTRERLPKPPDPIASVACQDSDLTYRPSRKGLLAVAKQIAAKREHDEERRRYELVTKYECKVLATIIASDEDSALLRLGQNLRDRGNGRSSREMHVSRVSVNLVPQGSTREFGPIARSAS